MPSTKLDDEFLQDAEFLAAGALKLARESGRVRTGKRITSRALALLATGFVSLAKQHDVGAQECGAMLETLWEHLENDPEDGN